MCGEICRRSASAFCRVARPNWASIPTPVGKQFQALQSQVSGQVYPHTCGETMANSLLLSRVMGLSPHLWGNLERFQGGCGYCGSYPHSCGETSSSTIPHACLSGLSPHLWGNHQAVGHKIANCGSIPTPVGKPSHAILSCLRLKVYPHTCGETGLQ